MALLMVATGENWHKLMYDCEQASSVSSYLYFMSFSIIITFIMLNFFVMVVLQALDDHYENPESPIEIFSKNVK